MTEVQSKCREVDESLGDLIDGIADDEMLDHLASCERCRDVRYEAEQVSLLVADAAGDYRFPEQLGERLMRAVDAPPARASQRPWSAALGRVSRSSRPTPPSAAAPAPQTAASPHAPLPPVPGYTGRPSARWAWLSLATAVGLGVLWLAGRREPGEAVPAARNATRAAGAWQGQVADVERAIGSPTGLVQCARGTQVCQPIGPGDVAHAGMRLETDGLTRARIQLADGSTLALDRSSRFELDPSERRRGRLLAGSVVAEIEAQADAPATPPAPATGPSGAAGGASAAPPGQSSASGAVPTAVRAIIDVPFGRAEVLGTKFSLRTGEDGTRVEVSRGSVKLIEEEQGRFAFVNAGEAALLVAGAAPRVEASTDLGSALEWSTSAFEPQPEATHGALGSLVAKRPSDGRELSDAVHLASHDVKVRIVDNVARTEVEEVFENGADEVLEGIYRFPLPPGAQLERLALEVDGRLEEGVFVDRERAAAIWRGAVVNAGGKKPPPSDEIVWVPGPWRDPALLEWQRGNRFELRIFPIPKRGARRVVLAYTELLAPSEGQRHYVYPLPSDPRGSTTVARFGIEVQVRGHDAARPVTANGYDLAVLSGSPEVARLGFEARNFVPRGDLTLAYSLASTGELRATAYQPGPAPTRASVSPPRSPSSTSATSTPAERSDRDALPVDAPFVSIALRPTLPRRTRYEALDYVLVADTSRSMFGESYRQATRVVARLCGELDRSARVTVLGCDSTCQALPGGFLAPGEATAEAARRFLEGIEPEGASDLALAVESAAALRPRARRDAAASRALRVIYVGDGTPTVGPIHPALLEPAIANALPPGASLNAIAIGSDTDRGSLRVATRAGGGTTIAFAPGVSVDDVVYAVLGSSYGQTLTDARLELPEGLVQVLPKKLGSVAAGAEQMIVARMTRPHVSGAVVLHGQLAGEPFERRYALDVTAQPGEANAFVPRLYASVAIAELEASLDEASKQRSIDLSTRFGVASRYTSLLVLESPAMFSAFGLSNRREAPSWSGEVEASSSESSAEDRSEPLESVVEGRAGSGGPGTAAAKSRAAPLAVEPNDADGIGTEPESPAEDRVEQDAPRRERPLEQEPGLVPMRRVWERVGKIEAPPAQLAAATEERRQTLARLVEEQSESRSALRNLYVASLLAGDLDAAGRAAERWAAKDPLDVEALTARADVAAQRGDREQSIRMLGSVVDINPADHKAQWRLARLHRWAGQPGRGCRHALAVAQLRSSDAQLVSDGIGCARDAGDDRSADMLLAALGPNVRSEVERLARKRRSSDELSGDFRVVASWQGGEHDLDLVILHPDGYRVSWLGAPTRAVITASDVLGFTREGLALRGAGPGQYAIELVRSSPANGPVRGNLRIVAPGAERNLPFVLEGERIRVATVTLRNESRLVPLQRFGDPRWE